MNFETLFVVVILIEVTALVHNIVVGILIRRHWSENVNNQNRLTATQDSYIRECQYLYARIGDIEKVYGKFNGRLCDLELKDMEGKK